MRDYAREHHAEYIVPICEWLFQSLKNQTTSMERSGYALEERELGRYGQGIASSFSKIEIVTFLEILTHKFI